ncbi:HCP-like protein [Aureobasidium sp. EXF-3400]|nr:HCP-like protein [Aureobasidium sp. EXF-12344]KAI4776280.1 HCP-like protein [Aureobasidium sp. EXF-3400]
MAKRPQNLDLSSARGHDRLPSRTRPNFYMDLPSPRAGEIPPALSPLDAFALHSRALARKLEESGKAGRRMSRLPHQDIADELAKRPGYFRSVSSGVESLYDDEQEEEDDEVDDGGQWQRPRLQAQTPNGAVYRPVSHYPMLGNVVRDDQDMPSVPKPVGEADAGPEGKGYFGIKVPRSSSPEPFDSRNIKNDEASPALPSLTSSIDSIQSSQPRTMTNESTRTQDNSLAPPRSPAHPRSARSIASIRSVIDSAEEDNGSPSGSLEVGPSRKIRAPFSPEMLPVSRSPSALSEYSVASDLPRPSFNFSRPRGNSLARPGAENNLAVDSRRAIERQNSNDSSMSHAARSTNSAQTMRVRAPVERQNSDSATDLSGALSDRDCFSGEETPAVHPGPGAPSYVYSKYSLPRGRMLDRDSVEARASWAQHQFKWEQKSTGLEPGIAESPLPSPNLDNPMLSPGPATPRGQSPAPGSNRNGSTGSPAPSPSRLSKKTTPQTPSIASENTNRTIRAGSHVRNSPSTDIAGLSPEQHLEKGIECHSSGSLSKSTYHLRLAARAGLPTAMLLYALACRHGWGMRPNQAEGVSWLRRAVDSAGVEFIEDSSSDGSQAVSKEQKARKAQFALAIYELGMSYMNGWGIPKDKPLAVRCFEIAGSWGDTDALAEAGFCYTQGVGCKKDLKKAAEFYRQAADKGMSMAGNSWIYKPKYMPDPPPWEESPEPAKKSRGRSRTLFGRKKPTVTS